MMRGKGPDIASQVEVRVLGPVEAVRDGVPVALGGPRQRALLGALALRVGQVVSVDRLVEDLWGADAPERAAATLRSSISHLRTALDGPDAASSVLVARKPGYVLELPREAVDAELFESDVARGRRLLASGDAPGAAKTLTEALNLWRGPVLTGVTVPPSLDGRVAGLDELRLTASEDRLDAEVALGRHLDVLGELEGLIAEHPLRERLRELQMLALYRAGRRAEALRAYQSARALLADELGLDPGRRLQELEAAILRQDPSLDPRSSPISTGPPPVENPVDDPPLVGRERELAQLRAVVQRAVAGSGGLALVLGEAGIGKTRLLDALAGFNGVRVVRSRCDEGQGAPAFWPWVQVVRSLLADGSDEQLAADTAGVAAHIGLLAPELHGRIPMEPLPDLEPESARFLLFDAVATLLARRSAEEPLLVLIDDLQWADVPSLRLLAFMARRLSDLSAAVVVTCREEAVSAEGGSGPVLSTLTGLAGVERVGLRGFTQADVGLYLAITSLAEPSPEVVAAVWRRTDGNPFFVAEVARTLALSPDAEVVVPEGVRAAVGQRLSRLPDWARRVLDVAAVAGRDFQLLDVHRAAGVSRDELMRAVGAGATAGIVAPVDGSIRAYRFQHDLLRETAYDAIPVHERLAIHGRLGAAIEQADREGARVAEIALHFYLGAPVGDPVRAIEFALRAAQEARQALAYEEAVVQADRAAELLELCDAPSDELCIRVFMKLGDSRWRAGLGDAAREAYQQAAEAARRAGLAREFALAALGCGSTGVTTGLVDERLVMLLREALDVLDGYDGSAGSAGSVEVDALRARVLARMAMELYFSTADDVSRAAALADEAVALARTTSDRRALGETLAARHFCLRGPDDLARRLAVGEELLTLAEQSGDADLALQARHGRIADLLELGDIDGFETERAAYAEMADALHQRGYQGQALAWTALGLLLRGSFAAAETTMVAAFEQAQSGNVDSAMQVFGVQFATLRREQDRHHEVYASLADMAERFPGAPAWRCGQVLLASEMGRLEEARALVEALGDFEDIPRDVNWLPAMSTLAVTVYRLGSLAAPEWAPLLYDLLVAFEERFVVVGGVAASVCYGSVAHYLGLLAACMGRADVAALHYEKALERNAGIDGAPWVAHTLLVFAELLAGAGAGPGPGPGPGPGTGPGSDPVRASVLRASASEAASRMGMALVARQLAALPDSLDAWSA